MGKSHGGGISWEGIITNRYQVNPYKSVVRKRLNKDGGKGILGINMDDSRKTWRHPGGKFRRLGPSSCSDKELLAIIIGSGTKGKSAEQIAADVVDKYHSIYGLMGKSLEEIEKIKGLKMVKATRLAAVFELARRVVKYLEKQ